MRALFYYILMLLVLHSISFSVHLGFTFYVHEKNAWMVGCQVGVCTGVMLMERQSSTGWWLLAVWYVVVCYVIYIHISSSILWYELLKNLSTPVPQSHTFDEDLLQSCRLHGCHPWSQKIMNCHTLTIPLHNHKWISVQYSHPQSHFFQILTMISIITHKQKVRSCHQVCCTISAYEHSPVWFKNFLDSKLSLHSNTFGDKC